ncbi:MAG: hypothetical protein L0H93_07175 [Nocardioides sp.]|nr:hypothetical protein [Nocardioides sp.]
MTTNEDERLRDYSPGNPLVFSHIPKTAGTSLRTALVETLQPDVLVRGVDTSLVGGYDDYELLRGVAADFHFSPDDLDADATLVAGHIAPGTTMVRYPGADHITMLRNPRLRVLSQWLHCRSLSDFDLRHYGRAGTAFRLGRLPFGEYLNRSMIAPNTDNTITRFLAWPHPLLATTEFIPQSHDGELLDVALARIDEFAHVGLVEDPAAQRRLGEWLGRPLPETRVNERATRTRRRTDLASELDDATLERLDQRTRLDRQVWSHVARRMLPDQDPDAVLEASWAKSIARYAGAARQKGASRPVRRAVEIAYGIGYRLDPRRDRY